MNLLAIDSGTNAIGYAIWKNNTFGELTIPDIAKVFIPEKKFFLEDIKPDVLWLKKTEIITYKIDVLLRTQRITDMYIEWPATYNSSFGRAVSGHGDIQKLSFMIGQTVNECVKRGINYYLVPVVKWKGSLSKKVVNERIIKAIGNTSKDGIKFDSHAFDAVGIGLYAKGFQINDKVFV